MAIEYVGSCSCGAVKVRIELPEAIENYSPRACDCDFCTSRNIQYLSHPDGALFIETSTPLEVQKQGSNQADFLTCRNCNDVSAVSIGIEGNRIGALNSTILDDYLRLKKAEVASPKLLTAHNKVQRWKSLWLPISVKER